MLAFLGLGLLLAGVAVFVWTLRLGVYRRYPYDLFALVGAAALLGLLSVLDEATSWRVGALAVELALLAVVSIYFGVGIRFRRRPVGLEAGDRFPDFTLTDSQGRLFDSRSLHGEAPALYLFYRGDW